MKKMIILILVMVLLCGCSTNNSAKIDYSEKPDVGKCFVNAGNSEYYERFKTTTQMVDNLHFFDFEEYLSYYGESVSYYADEDANGGMMVLSYSVTGNQKYNLRIETDVVPYDYTLGEYPAGAAYSFIKVIDNEDGSTWESVPQLVYEADYIADYGENGHFFYMSRDTFRTLIDLTQSDRLEDGYVTEDEIG